MPDEKRCGKCKRTKPLDDFHRNRATKDGRQYWCKDCVLGRIPTDTATPDTTPEPAPAPRTSVPQRAPKAIGREHGLGDGNWKPAVTTLSPGQCVKGCGRTGDVFGRCHIHAAAELAHSGVIRRRAWRLLEVLATDDNLLNEDRWKQFLEQLADSIVELHHALTDGNDQGEEVA